MHANQQMTIDDVDVLRMYVCTHLGGERLDGVSAGRRRVAAATTGARARAVLAVPAAAVFLDARDAGQHLLDRRRYSDPLLALDRRLENLLIIN